MIRTSGSARDGPRFLGLAAFCDLLYNQAANDLAAEFVRGKIREIVHDPEIAEMLSPRNVIGCKRLCVDTGYWETYNRPNVTLIDVSGEPIEAITPAGPAGEWWRNRHLRRWHKCRSRCEAPDGAIADGFASRNGATIRPGDPVPNWHGRLVCSRCGSRTVDMVVTGERR